MLLQTRPRVTVVCRNFEGYQTLDRCSARSRCSCIRALRAHATLRQNFFVSRTEPRTTEILSRRTRERERESRRGTTLFEQSGTVSRNFSRKTFPYATRADVSWVGKREEKRREARRSDEKRKEEKRGEGERSETARREEKRREDTLLGCSAFDVDPRRPGSSGSRSVISS